MPPATVYGLKPHAPPVGGYTRVEPLPSVWQRDLSVDNLADLNLLQSSPILTMYDELGPPVPRVLIGAGPNIFAITDESVCPQVSIYTVLVELFCTSTVHCIYSYVLTSY